MRTAFTIGYIVLSLTDFFDGVIARKFNQKSPIGPVLDSVGDVPFYLSTASFIYKLYPEMLTLTNAILLIVAVAFMLSVFIVAKIKFGKPAIIHTFLMRKSCVLVFFLMIIAHFMNAEYFLSAILIIYTIGFVEQLLIFQKYGLVHLDSISIYHIAKGLDPLG